LFVTLPQVNPVYTSRSRGSAQRVPPVLFKNHQKATLDRLMELR
jgi:hypothetical protein